MEKENLSGALRTTLNILDAWGISQSDRLALLGCDVETYGRWVRTGQLGAVSPETLERLSYLLGIWKALQVLFPDPAAANTWIHRPNTSAVFSGEAPLSTMVRGKVADLARVRSFLDSWCY
jgi:hypothetical protein